ncbi:AAA family ATPase [Thioflexithrix psekupsensis]|uniref:ATPase AAA-type core domain-containing protein n=1 Tax=Thioflexithrix psekupsensis TaxID=1570016 RepID=A0A251XB96_9GAMM|nr:AAA family ATPase [Thioflexithrix psekupsensis]OUD15712.1 hypothetical protein TPSD3_04155 [Thioflexithrix psekupsensis]
MTSPLSEFAIYGLYGDRDIVIEFPYPIKILVSENGMGKTTVLNILYSILSGRFYRLENMLFERIIVKFATGSFCICKDEINQFLQDEQAEDQPYKEIQEKIGKEELRKLVSLAREHSAESLAKLKEVRHISNALKIPSPLLAEKLKVLDKEEKGNYSQKIQELRKYFDLETLYLTTYRRIEEDLQQLGYLPADLQLPSHLLQSGGMDDVLEKLEKIEGIAIEHQLTPEQLLQRFADICNNYLIDKKFICTDQSLEIHTKKGRLIPFHYLSSGEKQIISIFSHLYLSSPKKCAVLIDEPELSMSIEWQRTLLLDILKAPRCEFLVATTHSPFIFDDELMINTVGLKEYIREYD